MSVPVNDTELREYTAARFTSQEAVERCIRWVRAQEAVGHEYPTTADAVGIYVLTGVHEALRNVR